MTGPRERLQSDEEVAPPTPPVRREALAMSLIIMAFVGFLAYRPIHDALVASPSEQACARLIERYWGHSAAIKHPELSARKLVEAKRAARAKPAYFADMENCRDRLTAEQARCGIASVNLDALERCLQ